jgi:hypothetical protein
MNFGQKDLFYDYQHEIHGGGSQKPTTTMMLQRDLF